MLENKKINGVHATRYIMSWTRMGGNVRYIDSFVEWLKTLNMSEEDIDDIVEILRSGKMELETSAGRFLKSINESEI